METVNFRELFQQNCYKPALELLLEGVSDELGKSVDTATRSLLDPLSAFLRIMEENQGKEKMGPVSRICISLLRTSVYLEKPVLLVEAYETVPFVLKPVMACEINAKWMFTHWKAFQDRLLESVQQQSLSRYVRKPELKSYESRAVSAMMRCLAFHLKYIMRVLENDTVYSSFREVDDFTVSFGEYMDWQMPMLMWRKNLDIFLCDENNDLTFRRFHKLHYENKQFPARDMDECVFSECVFRKTDFRGTKFRNVRFKNCTFEDCRFEDVELMGSSILSCRLQRVVFRNCLILGELHKEGRKIFLYPNGKFKWSLLEEIQWIDSDVTEDIYEDCQLFNVAQGGGK